MPAYPVQECPHDITDKRGSIKAGKGTFCKQCCHYVDVMPVEQYERMAHTERLARFSQALQSLAFSPNGTKLNKVQFRQAVKVFTRLTEAMLSSFAAEDPS